MSLLKIVYVREWRLTLKMTAGLFQWFEGRFIRVKALYWRWKHSREKAPEPETEILPPEESVDVSFNEGPEGPGKGRDDA